MNIINRVKNFFKKNDEKKITSEQALAGMSVAEKEKKVFQKEKLRLQKLYETWSCKESWLLREEGIPLLLGLKPADETLNSELENKIDQLWQHAQDCVKKKLLPVLNHQESAIGWRVSPLDLYSWATVSRISMPEEFSLLMSFVAQTLKIEPKLTESVTTESKQDVLYQKHREIVLGAAVSLLVNAPTQCKNKRGKVVSNLIAKSIITNEEHWFADERPMLAETAMTDLIEGYLKLSKPIIM